MSLVDFVVIGAMKAGTSTLYQTLKGHPSVSLTKKKEANFFNHQITLEKTEWYKNQFGEEHKTTGDVSPNYAKFHQYPCTAKQLFETSKETKIIYLVRDPLKRIISHVHHDMLRDRVSTQANFDEVFLENKDYILTSSYHSQLSSFLDFFSTEQILIISFEEMLEKTAATLFRITSFLGLESNVVLELSARNLTEKRYKIPFHDSIHDKVSNQSLLKAYHLFWYFLNIKVSKPVLNELTLKTLAEKLAPDINAFCQKYPGIRKNWKLYNQYSIS